MPFGLGVGELIIAILSLAVPAVVLVLAVAFISRMIRSPKRGRDELDQRQLAAELQQARQQIDELEARVTRVDEKASFTQELLEKPRSTHDQ